jgi:hypothetical protein
MKAPKKCVVTRDVSRDECHWLSKGLKAGDTVWTFYGVTYGCIGPGGTAMSWEPNTSPFFEVPNDAWEVAQ